MGVLFGAKAHDALHARAVVPATVEDHDLSRRWQVRQVALGVHLRSFALGGRRDRHHAEDPRADPLGDRLDRAALAGAVAPFEDHADLGALGDDPLLQLDELGAQPREFLLVFLSLELVLPRGALGRGGL